MPPESQNRAESDSGPSRAWSRPWWLAWLIIALALAIFLWTAWPGGLLTPDPDSQSADRPIVIDYFNGRTPTGPPHSSGRAASTERLALDRAETSLTAYAIWQVNKPGRYRLDFRCDDFGSLYLDGQSVINLSGLKADNLGRTALHLAAGRHLLVIRLGNGPVTGWTSLTVSGPDRPAGPLIAAELSAPAGDNLHQRWQSARLAKQLEPLIWICLLAGLLTLAGQGGLGRWGGRAVRRLAAGFRNAWPSDPGDDRSGAAGLAKAWFWLVAAAVILEIAFELSKPSVMSQSGFLTIALTALTSIALLALPGLAVCGLWGLAHRYLPAVRPAAKTIRVLILAALGLGLAALIITHVDTFCYTTFHANVTNLPAAWRLQLLIAVGLAGLWLAFDRGPKLAKGRMGLSLSLAWLALGLIALGSGWVEYRAATQAGGEAATLKAEGRPNIILFAGDGINADHLSTYGYHRPTSPTLDRLAGQSMVYDLAFTNANTSSGSVASILTGALPVTTRLLSFPGRLKGRYAFRHLPGILARLGYYCVDLSDDRYANADAINLREAYHLENGRPTGLGRGGLGRLFNLAYSPDLGFVNELLARITDRIGYLAGWSDRLDRHNEEWQGLEEGSRLDDQAKIDQLIDLIGRTQKPLFVHLHLLKTHGPRFEGLIRRFSAGRDQQTDFEADFYDDAILTVDGYLARVIEALKRAEKWDHTLLIFHTDHAQGWRIEPRLPLVVHLPGQKEGRRVEQPVQYIDLAPSIMTALGLKAPDWMDGDPIFPAADQKRLDQRTVYSFYAYPADSFSPLEGLAGARVIKDGLAFERSFQKPDRGKLTALPGRELPAKKFIGPLRNDYRTQLYDLLRRKGFNLAEIPD